MTDGNLFKEIQDDIERQKLEALWKKYGAAVLAGAVAIVLGTGGISAWLSWQEARQSAATEAWYQAAYAQAEQGDAAVTALQAVAQTHPETQQAVMAGLQAAALLGKRGDRDGAVALYGRLANDQKASIALRHLAVLNSVRLQADAGDRGALLNSLQPLLAEGTPWRAAASELAGHLALAEGEKIKARQYFSTVAQDATAPSGMAKRAEAMLRLLSDDPAPAAVN